MQRALLVFPGASEALVRAHARAEDFVVAVDAGAECLRRLARVPDLLVGDLDSVSAATADWARERGARVDRHPPVKDATDGELALLAVGEAEEVVFLGAGGGRADHALGNLQLLVRAAQRARVVAHDEDASYWVATPARPLVLELAQGRTVSALPFEGVVEGVTYASMRYPLENATLVPGTTRGLSNLAGPPPQRVEVARGALLVVAPREG